MTRTVQDAIDIFRTAIGRRNENDPDSSDELLFRYLNDFASLTMPNDTKLYESFGTLTFTIDENTSTSVDVVNGSITLQEACDQSGIDFTNISQEAYISLLDPQHNSISWNYLPIYQDPGEFFAIWGINNEEILIPGYPTNLLFYGNVFTFRTIPQTSYQIKIFGYKKNRDFPTFDDPLEYDWWLRYLAYGAAVNYARDYRYAAQARADIEKTFQSERNKQLTRTHNQIKMARAMPRF